MGFRACSNWGNWVAAAGLTGGRVNKFNIAKQSNVSPASLGAGHASGALGRPQSGSHRLYVAARIGCMSRHHL